LRYQLAAYVMSAMLCGVAGLLLANLTAFASPSSLSWVVSGDLIVMVVLGRLGSVFGPVLGALAFLGMEEVLKGMTEHWMAIFGPIIVLVALLGRAGIVGLLMRLDRRSDRRSADLAIVGEHMSAAGPPQGANAPSGGSAAPKESSVGALFSWPMAIVRARAVPIARKWRSRSAC
jgi:hypothetical protein